MQGADIEDVYNLSPLQQGMLFHNLLQQDDAYVVQFCLRLAGPLSVQALEQAWERVLAQHPVLRTTFHWEKLQAPAQVVHRRVKLPVEVHDWREREGDLAGFLERDRARGFDLTRAPLMRLAVLRTGPEEHLLVWTHHHLLLDGWSVALVVGQVFTLYEALALGTNRELERSRPFREYIAWLRRQDLAEAEPFWRSELDGFTTPTPLGAREPLPGRSGFGEATLRVSSETTAALQAMSREHQVTLNTLAQGAWALLLARHSGEEDVLFGVTVSGRPAGLPGVESMVGLFINTLPLRVPVEPETLLLAWLARLQERQTAVRQYEHSPLFEVQGWSDAPRGTPLFNGLFVFENFPTAAERRAGPTSVEIRDGRMIQPAGYPLTLAVTPGAEMGLRLVYDLSRFDEIEILRFQGHLRTLLESIAAAPPGQRLSGIEMLTAAERHQALVEWNDTAIDFPSVAVHRLFEEWAERTPDAPALTVGERTLTYRELDRRANHLAWRLAGLGVGPESLVGLFAERSLEMIVGMLAILKAGGAYLPLDPGHPRERLALLLGDAGATLVLAQPALAGRLPEGIARVISLETIAEGVEVDAPAERLPDRAGGHNLVYVIYTSGSTGRPKGVEIQHAGVSQLARHAGDGSFATGPEEVWLQLAPMAFDASITEIWSPLANGGRLVLYPAETPTLDGIAATVRRHGVTSLWLTAGLFHQMVERGLGDLPSIRQLLAGGDVLSVPHVEETLRQLPGARLVNGYGPTETTVVISYHPMSAPVGSTVPIGRPIPGSRAYLLGPDLRPVPPGAPGRLFAGSRGLARGYLRRPDLTAERFVPDPFTGLPGSRLYDTGDLARWRPDGILEFLGRTDAQVKIRGFRVEPGEVESVLREHPDVANAVVLARPDATGQSRLVAWLVLDPKSKIQNPKSLLPVWLAERLPDPLIPTAWVVLDALPLTPNGKVDRRALPEPDTGRRETEGLALGPRTPTEEVLAGIWEEVLGRVRVGIEEEFFELGGHSLAAIQVVSRIRKTFGIEVPLRALFEEPTVAALARRIEDLRRSQAEGAEPPLVPVPRGGDLPLSFAQQRLWFLDRLEPGRPTYNIPIALRLQGDLGVGRLEEALAALVRRHESLRTTFPDRGGEPVQRTLTPWPPLPPALTPTRERGNPLPGIDLGALPLDHREAEALRLAREEAAAPFDLGQGPLLRSRLLHLGTEDHLLLLTLHHIVSDGWSMGVLVRDVIELYQSGSLPRNLPIQYGDYAVWQRQWLQGETLQARLSWWLERMAGAPALLDLPTDRPRPPLRTARGASVTFELSPALSAGVRALGRKHGATLHMTWLAALTALLQRSGAGTDLPVGTTVANRDRREIEDLIGFFVNTLVLRADAAGDPPVSDLLKRARETALAAYAHRELPFEKLVEELRPERSLAYTPLFQVLVAVQNAPAPPIELADLVVSAVRQPVRTAEFDLALTVLDTEPALAGNLTYATDLFDAATVRRMVDHLTVLLGAMIESPAHRLSELPLATEAELAQILTEWSGTAAPAAPIDACLHELLDRQVERGPDDLAVRFRDEELTFRELAARADRLARWLRRQGVGPEVPVALCLERSTDLLAGLFGILKAGGAFVPLDPAAPPRRLELVLEDCGAPLLVTQESLLPLFPPAWRERAVCLDRDGEAFTQAAGVPLPRVDPSNLCYVIYTSGSTGQPKGVLIQHASVVSFANALRQTVFTGLPGGLRVSLNAPLAFDASIQQVVQLLFGNTLDILPDELRLDPENLAAYLEAHAIDVLDCTPSQIRLLLAAQRKLRTIVPFSVLVGGEALDEAIWESLAGERQTIYWNAYGPTECTVDTTVGRVEPGPVTIGRPLPGAAVYIFDPDLRPVPAGVAGQLHVGGAGLARGYLGRPDLTAEKFLPNPFGSGSRLYATGDLARWLPDGRIEFRGRLDHQVKIRGYRLELGEVESVLATHPDIQDAAVLVRGVSPDQHLVAWVVPHPKSKIQNPKSDLRAWLADRLPGPMIPSAFVTLDTLPLTAHGKVDRRALPDPQMEREEDHTSPRTPTEEILAGIWGEVLGRERIGIDADFFDLGGHSLSAVQVVSRVRASFGLELPLRALFEAPTVAALAARIDSLQPAREEALVPIRSGGDLPLSFAQQRLWFLDRLEPGRPTYNIPVALWLRGELRPEALESALAALVARHDSLRTTFAEHGGEAVQRISPDPRTALSRIDLQTLPQERREPEAERLAHQEALAPFDLTSGPLLRSRLLRLDAGDHLLLLTMHHIVSDGWSMGVLVRDMIELYQAFSAGVPASLPALPIQYADYAVVQRRQLQGEKLRALLSFWQEHLAEAPAVLDLPADRPRPPVRSGHGAHASFELPPDLSAQIRALGRRHGATLHMTWLAALAALLARYGAGTDLPVGTTVANRDRRELEDLIGFFVNTLVLRMDASGDPSVPALLERARETALAAYANQDLPFERLVEELQPERSLAHTPLFQVLLAVQNAPAPPVELPGLVVSPLRQPAPAARFDLALTVLDAHPSLAGTLTFATDLFEAATAHRMLEHLNILLDAMAFRPDRHLSELPVTTEAELAQILGEWSGAGTTAPAWPADACLHELFDEQAERGPDDLAVRFRDEELTFGELATRADQLARWLRRQGVGPEVPVALCLERSTDLLAGLFGILKAGGAFVPLDPAAPPRRLELVLGDCGAPLLVTQESLLPLFPQAWRERAVCLDRDRAVFSQAARVQLPRVHPSNLCYVIYTSGSTGQPKGVLIQHASVVSFAAALRQTVFTGLSGGLRVSLNAPLAFDASIQQVVQLLFGDALDILPDELRLDPESLPAYLEAHRIDVLDCTPSQLRLLLAGQRKLRTVAPFSVLVGGEALDEALWESLAEERQTAYWNAYGPTECTVDTTVGRVEPGPVTIGRPLPGAAVYILDPDLRPVPAGVTGQLHVGGAGLARGYLGRPGLTAEKFLPHPFGSGSRLYATGDLARRLPDGRIEFRGRLDHQVKIRGYRLELGEVESVLATHPEIHEAVVLVRGEGPGQHLVAWVVPDPQSEIQDLRSDLRAWLADRLPGPMIPSSFVVMEALPLTAQGKVDRRALPDPEVSQEGRHTAPRTPTEEILAGIWGEVLGRERIGIDEDFFDLGGHSLSAVQVVSRVRASFGLELPLRALFEAPTVAALAARIDSLQPAREEALVPNRIEGDLPLSFSQQRLWFLDRLEPGRPTYNIPIALWLRGELRPEALESALSALVARHESLRTTFAERAGDAVQRISPDSRLGLIRIDLQTLPQERREPEAERLAHQEALAPFDLATGPLLRSRLLRLDAGNHLLLLTMHHIVSDGWSMGVLVRDMIELYRSFSTGAPATLPALPIQYADYAVMQRRQLQGETLRTRLSFWRERLAVAPAVLDLPADRPRPPVRSGRGDHAAFEMPPGLSAQVRALGRRHGATLHMTWLAALGALLARYGAGKDLPVGTTVANRDRRELEDLIGFFVNTLVLRMDASGDPSVPALLERARETALAAYAHQDLPFERLVEELQPERSLAHTPLFQVLLAVQNAPAPPVELPGLVVSPLRQPATTSRFDLSLTVLDAHPSLAGNLTFATDLFDAATAHRMLAYLTVLLGAMAGRPDLRLSELPVATEAELAQILGAWSGVATATPFPTGVSVHELFARQAELTPQAPAVRFRDEVLTFRELDNRSDLLARYLRGQGVGPEVPVALCLERSTGLLVAVLAILKAGGAFVPFDPTTPPRRLEMMLEDSGAPVVVTQESLLSRFPGYAGRSVCLDRDSEAIVEEGAGRALPLPQVEPTNLCYVIYTSGSTGRPKGTLIQHASVVNLAHALRRTVYAGLPAGLRVAVNAPLAFDGSIKQVIQILFGDLLDILPDDLRLDPEALPPYLAAHSVDVLDCTPSQLRLFLGEGSLGTQTPLARVLVGGEAVDQATWDALAANPRTGFWNVYGPTECTVDTTVAPIEAGSPTIGRPIPNAAAYLLDPDLRPVPTGVAGQLWVAGAGLARGYLGRPDLTAERFIPDPFAAQRGEPGARLYATGDLARWLPDGRIEFHGRADHQVKIRGFRTEPGEIEAVLAQYPGVREAAVVAVEEPELRLVAFLSSREIGREDLRAWLRDRLPAPMIPADFVTASAPLPRTPSGKVDRLALVRLAPREKTDRGELIAPRDPVEEQLAAIWSDLLKIERVGIRDNFFELGGHSLLATRLAARIRRDFRVDIPLRTLFETADLAALAQVILTEILREAGEDPQSLLAELDEMSEEEVQALLGEED